MFDLYESKTNPGSPVKDVSNALLLILKKMAEHWIVTTSLLTLAAFSLGLYLEYSVIDSFGINITGYAEVNDLVISVFKYPEIIGILGAIFSTVISLLIFFIYIFNYPRNHLEKQGNELSIILFLGFIFVFVFLLANHMNKYILEKRLIDIENPDRFTSITLRGDKDALYKKTSLITSTEKF